MNMYEKLQYIALHVAKQVKEVCFHFDYMERADPGIGGCIECLFFDGNICHKDDGLGKRAKYVERWFLK